MNAEQIFHEAFEISDLQKRAAFLDQACQGNDKLRLEVETLLRADDQAGSFLEMPAGNAGVTLDKAPPIDGPGTVIGRYQLLELVGEGGMGLVYLAEQKEPVKRRVAFKIIKPGMDSRQVIARFEAERQALAVLDHPNIAHVFDAGCTETGSPAGAGRPYFVMEYVKGMSITRHCDENRLAIEQRLRLFEQVCEAVHHAHQKGIIHRDLKPSNILVAVQGDKAVPKIIDFGIAKAITQPLTDSTVVTFQGQLLGTPEYMSPEQVDVAARDIDTRSDIYSLGVVLYELLAGVLPFESEFFARAGLAEIQQTIREQEPASPSIRLTSLGEQAKTIAASRSTQVVPLARRLHRELEWIPLKAMRKDRCRRYRSASEMADDIRNYLTGLPLIAGPETTIYRVQKFVHKHAGSVATVGLVAVAIVLGLIVSTVMYSQAEKAREEEALARSQETAARVQAQEAEKVAQEQRGLAEQAEKATKAKAEELRRALYANSIQLADVKYREGNTHRVRQLLESCPNDLRGWEWDRLNYIRDASIRTLSGTSDQSIRPVWGKDDCCGAAMLDPDGKRIVSGHYDGVIRVWDSATGKKLKEFRAHDRKLWSLAVSSNGQRVVSGGSDETTKVKVWDADTFEAIRTIPGPNNTTWVAVAVSPDGKRIVSSAGGEGVLRVWDTQSGSELMTLGDRENDADCLTFSPDGKHIISGGAAGDDVRIWDVTTGEMLRAIHADPDSVSCIAVNSDGSQIASACVADKVIKIWDAQAGVQQASFRGHERDFVQGLAFSPDGRHIVSGGSMIKIWETATGKELTTLRGHEAGISSLAFTRDGKRIVSGGWDGTVKLWDVSEEGEPIRLPGCQGRPNSIRTAYTVAFSPDGKRLTSNMEGMVKVWDVDSCVELMTLHQPIAVRQQELKSPQRMSIAFSTDGRLIGTSTRGGTIEVWDTERITEAVTLKVGQRVWDLAFSPDSNRLIAASGTLGSLSQPGGAIKIWDLSKRKEIMGLPLGDLEPLSVAFSADGKYVVSGFADGAIKVWDAASGAEVMGMTGRHGAVPGVAFSPDGKLIASGSGHGIPSIWDAATGGELTTLGGHNDTVLSIAFSPDGRRVLTGSNDRTAKVWDVATGAELLTLPFDSGVACATFNAQGTLVAAATADGAVFLLESDASAGRHEARETGRNATKLVDGLREKYGFYHDVIHNLSGDKMADKSVRRLALQIANSRKWEDADNLRNEAWQAVISSGKDTEAYQTAIEKAEKANDWEPNDPSILRTLGAAQYRTGAYEEALKTLKQTEKLSTNDESESDPADFAFAAMALHRLGRTDEAKSALEHLRTLSRDERFAEDEQVKALLAEAEKLIEGEKQ